MVTMSNGFPEIMTIGETAEYLWISLSSLYKLAQGGRVPCQKVGRRWRFRRWALDRWLEAYSQANQIGTTKLPRSMVTEAIRRLQAKGMLTMEEVHEELTHHNGRQTDRLLAVLRELPGVTFTASPGAVYTKK